jgi:ribose 5-phosphate isomerase A
MSASANKAESDPLQRYKEAAARRAVEFVRSGMALGLGSGSTAIFATRLIGQLLAEGKIRDVTGLPTSRATADEALRLGIPLFPDDTPGDLDLTLDGADEVDPAMNLIKGGGGALTREKIVAQASHRVVIIVDDSKRSPCLGTHWPVPVEVLIFGWRSQARFLEALGARVSLRRDQDGAPFQTDSGNWVLDCTFGPISDLNTLAARLSARAGIVEHGLFLNLATDLVTAGEHGVCHQTRGAQQS